GVASLRFLPYFLRFVLGIGVFVLTFDLLMVTVKVAPPGSGRMITFPSCVTTRLRVGPDFLFAPSPLKKTTAMIANTRHTPRIVSLRFIIEQTPTGPFLYRSKNGPRMRLR